MICTDGCIRQGGNAGCSSDTTALEVNKSSYEIKTYPAPSLSSCSVPCLPTGSLKSPLWLQLHRRCRRDAAPCPCSRSRPLSCPASIPARAHGNGPDVSHTSRVI